MAPTRTCTMRPRAPREDVGGFHESGLLRFRVWGLGFRVLGFGFRAWDLGFRVCGLGSRAEWREARELSFADGQQAGQW